MRRVVEFLIGIGAWGAWGHLIQHYFLLYKAVSILGFLVLVALVVYLGWREKRRTRL